MLQVQSDGRYHGTAVEDGRETEGGVYARETSIYGGRARTLNRKCAVIGCGFVGATCAFSLMQSALFSEMVLIDIDIRKDKSAFLVRFNKHFSIFPDAAMACENSVLRRVSGCRSIDICTDISC